jgi:beta-xylosidase
VTLAGHECLDGTYYRDDEGQRWIVFCHEWTELYECKIKALRLTDDLRSSYGEPVTILNAADMKWIWLFGDPRIEKTGYLTDTPFLYRARNGELLLLWSSYSVPNYGDKGMGGYTVAVARSASGRIEGPWTHDDELLMDRNAGHSSLFRDFEGRLWNSTHAPDSPHGQERPLFLRVRELENGLALE